ncbi:MAG: hypothetical protein U1D69_10380, partial [Polynucleobacter sp.]|nr:hypothetical protein [Polynucleobacter sp.]
PGISKWAGTYYSQAEFWSTHFSPLLIEPNGDLYLYDTKLNYEYDAGTDTLMFSGQAVRGARPTVKVKFAKGGEGKNTFSGVMYPQPGDGPGSFNGVQILKTQVWAAPTFPVDLPLIGRIYIGDHTWVAMSDNNCWNVVGGGPGYYCKDRWKKIGNTQVYFPPEGRLLNSTAAGNPTMTSCMGGEQDSFLGIPRYAGITYGLNGVCHQMTNRILLGADKITVWGAEGYALSVTTYGFYGVRVPTSILAPLLLIPIIGPIIGGFVAGINIAFASNCYKCGAPYPGPILSDQQEDGLAGRDQRFMKEVMKLHSQRKVEADPDRVFSMTADDFLETLAESEARHQAELALFLDYKVGNSISEHKIKNVLACYAKQSEISENVVREAWSNRPISGEAM